MSDIPHFTEKSPHDLRRSVTKTIEALIAHAKIMGDGSVPAALAELDFHVSRLRDFIDDMRQVMAREQSYWSNDQRRKFREKVLEAGKRIDDAYQHDRLP